MTKLKTVIGESFCHMKKGDPGCPDGDGHECKGPYNVHEEADGKYTYTDNPDGYTDYLISHCYFDNTGLKPEDSDEALPVVWGANATIRNCYIKNWGKGLLLGNGDEPAEMRKNMTITIENCIFDGNGRRNPYAQGVTVYMKNCIIKNWGKTFYRKSHAVRVADGARLIMEDCIFIQDKFVQTNLFNLLQDCYWQVDSFKNLWNFFYPGPMRGVYTENGGVIEKLEHCYKNKFWICFGKKDPSPMTATEAKVKMDEIASQVPHSPEEAALFKTIFKNQFTE